MLTRHERLVLIVFALVVLSGAIIKYAFRRYPMILQNVGLIETDVLYRKTDINSASFEELLNVPYIGRRSAEKIIRHRMQHGPFKNIADLRSVEGINSKLFERIQPFLCAKPVH